MLKLLDFFGLAIDEDRADIIPLMELLGINQEIENTKVVNTLKKKNGRDAPIVAVARRQQVLKMIKPMLNENMLEHDPNFYDKEINTSSEHDRRYGAEEKLLEYALLVASTKSKHILETEGGFISLKQLREAAFLETRFDRCWEILSSQTHHIVSAFRKG